MPSLLAIDVGLRCGFASYGEGGRLRGYASRHYRNRTVLRRGAWELLRDTPGAQTLVLEGGGPLADIWEHAARKQQLQVIRLAAQDWRDRLLFPREHPSAAIAKRTAIDMARRVIAWSGAARPTSLRDDAAEAILVGLWGVLELGWLPALPAEVAARG